MLSGGICCVSAAGKDCMGRGQRGELLPLRQRRAAGTVVAFLVTGRMPRLAASPSHPCHTSTGTLLPISPAHPIPHSYEEGTNLSPSGRTSPYRPPQCARELGWLGMPEGEVRAQHDVCGWGCGTAHACGCELVASAKWGLPEQHGSTGAWPSQLPRVPAACKPWGSPTGHMPAPAPEAAAAVLGGACGRRAVLAEDAAVKRE